MLLRMTLETRPDWLSLCLQDGFTYVTGGDPNPGDDKRPYNISNPELFKFAFQAQNVFFFGMTIRFAQSVKDASLSTSQHLNP